MTYNEAGTGGILLSGVGSNNYIYSYEAVGGVEVYSCAPTSKSIFLSTAYGPGDIAFSKFAALKGKVEKVCIKSVALNCVNGNSTFGVGCYPLYKDKYNSLWMDENLLNQDQAIALAQVYIDMIRAQEEALLRNC